MKAPTPNSHTHNNGDTDEETAVYHEFLEAYPSYQKTDILDELRRTEYGRLDANNHVYLDYTGGGLYAESQLDRHMALLKGDVFGNPHSHNPTSSAMTELVEQARAYVLAYFNADPDRYTAIFTPNASGALKLVGESYPFAPGSRYLLTADNHNSVNGIREFAKARGATAAYAPLTMPDLRLDAAALTDLLAHADRDHPHLFAYPAQSNFTGVQHDLDWIATAHRQGWDVLLDAAAFVPTNRLDLNAISPDFVTISFYKIFGYPTGVGCLIAKKEKLARLKRPWFAGGTVTFVSTQYQKHHLGDYEAAFEEGTVNYLSIQAVEIGLRHIEGIGIDTIHDRVAYLTGWLIDKLLALRHENGRPLIRLYGPATTQMRGGTITINFYDQNGRVQDYRRIEELANEETISLRTGCFCNPGAGETAEGLTEEKMKRGFEYGKEISLPIFREIIEHEKGKNAGAVRISVGLATNFHDVYRFLRFAGRFRNKSVERVGAARYNIEACRAVRLRDGS